MVIELVDEGLDEVGVTGGGWGIRGVEVWFQQDDVAVANHLVIAADGVHGLENAGGEIRGGLQVTDDGNVIVPIRGV